MDQEQRLPSKRISRFPSKFCKADLISRGIGIRMYRAEAPRATSPVKTGVVSNGAVFFLPKKAKGTWPRFGTEFTVGASKVLAIFIFLLVKQGWTHELQIRNRSRFVPQLPLLFIFAFWFLY